MIDSPAEPDGMNLFSRTRIGTRLAAALGAVIVLFIAVAMVGIGALGRGDRAVTEVNQLLEATRDVQEIKYFNADVSGWQVAYAWEAAKGDPRAAVQPDAPTRAGYIDVAKRFRAFLADINTDYLTAKENALLDSARTDLEMFFEMDDEIVALYEKATDASVAKANELILGPSWDVYYRVLESTADLIASVEKRSEAAAKDAADQADAARIQMGVAVVLAVVLGVLLVWLVRRSITVPLAATTDALRRLGDKDLTVQVDIADRGELGEMAAAINQAATTLRETVTAVKSDAARLATASTAMLGANQEILQSTQVASGLVQEAASSAGEVSHNAHSVAAGTEEMGASITEISRSASEAASVANSAVSAATDASSRIDRLGAASQEIGAVVATISAIAEQTNLLALNATIEAARAGEMGKGFAVVATEVKELAGETAKATEDISSRVAGIQQETAEVVGTIREITDVIGRVNDYVTTIASAVEEQSATTSSISVSVHQAASGSGLIAERVRGVADIVSETDGAVAGSSRTLEELTEMAAAMDRVTATFRV